LARFHDDSLLLKDALRLIEEGSDDLLRSGVILEENLAQAVQPPHVHAAR